MSMARYSKGCLPCRTRKVRCDERKPICSHCMRRGDLCTGYRDPSTLIFHDQTALTARRSRPRSASVATPVHTPESTTTDLSEASRSTHTSPSVHGDTGGRGSIQSADLVDRFFDKFAAYPCSSRSNASYLQHLPSLFKEASTPSRQSLRLAVQAVSLAAYSADTGDFSVRNKTLAYYGRALRSLAQALSACGQEPDDYNLMTVVMLDLFETLFLGPDSRRDAHTEGMAHMLRVRSEHNLHDSRGWSLFRLAHHRLKQRLASALDTHDEEQETQATRVQGNSPTPLVEKETQKFVEVRRQARDLLKKVNDGSTPTGELLSVIFKMQNIDSEASIWRRNDAAWSYQTVHRNEIALMSDDTRCPDFIELHGDAWMAYEWNYHRTARVLVHTQMVECIDRALTDAGRTLSFDDRASLADNRSASVQTMQELGDQVLATVPQSFGEVDASGQTHQQGSCEAVGAYFLLWPTKIIKANPHMSAAQRGAATKVFQRIRRCTGMEAALGDASNI